MFLDAQKQRRTEGTGSPSDLMRICSECVGLTRSLLRTCPIGGGGGGGGGGGVGGGVGGVGGR